MNLSTADKMLVIQYFSGKPVRRVYIFGSYARNEADEKSDIDIMVELDYSKHIGMSFFLYHEDLEQILHRKVDVVTEDGISRHIKPNIDKDKILIYERKTD
jgi:uncharacterized protein